MNVPFPKLVHGDLDFKVGGDADLTEIKWSK